MSTPLAAPGREATSFFGKQQIHQSRSVGRRKIADNRLLDHSQHINPSLLKGCVGALELLTMAAVGYLIVQFYVPHLTPELNASYLTVIGLTSGVFVAIADSLGLYRRRSFSQVFGSVPRLVLAVALALGALAISMLFLKITGVFSRVWFLTWFVSGTAALVTGRLFLAACVAHWTRNGQLSRRAVIYGGGEDCERLLAALESDPDCDLAIIGIFDDRGSARTGESISGYPRIGTLGELIELSRSSRVDMAIVAMPLTAEDRLSAILKELSVLPVDIRVPANSMALRLSPRAYTYVGRVPMLAVFDKPISGWGVVAKWLFDKVIAALALVLLAPVLAAVAVAVRMDSPGPILFRQKRYGFNNELISVFKFRSMYTDMTDVNAGRLVTKGDPRVTPVGRFIRKSSLDELPQLFNVLLGDLSLVGPRPHALQAKAADRLYDDVVDGYFARHKVKPGITGWAQINGWRGETDTEDKIKKRVECDLFYIENWSVFFDLYILLRTPFSLIKNENAY